MVEINIQEFKFEKLSIRLPKSYKSFIAAKGENFGGISAYIRHLIEVDYGQNLLKKD